MASARDHVGAQSMTPAGTGLLGACSRQRWAHWWVLSWWIYDRWRYHLMLSLASLKSIWGYSIHLFCPLCVVFSPDGPGCHRSGLATALGLYAGTADCYLADHGREHGGQRGRIPCILAAPE